MKARTVNTEAATMRRLILQMSRKSAALDPQAGRCSEKWASTFSRGRWSSSRRAHVFQLGRLIGVSNSGRQHPG